MRSLAVYGPFMNTEEELTEACERYVAATCRQQIAGTEQSGAENNGPQCPDIAKRNGRRQCNVIQS
jgi:hypothetical protein